MIRTACVSFGLQGLHQKDVPMVESKIMDVLKQTSFAGFDKGRIESSIHQMELGLKHVSSGCFCLFGLFECRNL